VGSDDLGAAPASHPEAMLGLWEAAADRGGVARALALLGAAHPGARRDELSELTVGRRDSDLLDLHDRLFGSRIDCTTACAACGGIMDVSFDSADIRVPEAPAAGTLELDLEGLALTVRLPDSRDLAAIEGARDAQKAWRSLVERCILTCRRGDQEVPVADLPDSLLEAVDAAAGEADPQADVVLSLACPDCAAEALVPFDIARQAWARLEHWAEAMLAAVDALAARYGWSEAQILALGPRRRQHYLDIAGAAR
jgi:hypothetical protein